MDNDRFDSLTRSLTAIASRRGVLRLLAGAALGALAARPAAGGAASQCRPGKELCQGQCVPVCEGGKRRNWRTCACECPDRMKECRNGNCVGQDRCCPDERRCSSGGCVPKGACCADERRCRDGTCVPEVGTTCCPGERVCDNRFCIPKDQCCFVTERECADGSCVAKDACCPDEKRCSSGNCISKSACCADERECPNGSCVAADACCPDFEETCPTDPRGCCFSDSQACSDDGCCELRDGHAVCDGKCVHTHNDNNHCGGCGVQCSRCQTCENGVCRGPNQATCETCVNGEVTPGVPCGGHCCRAGAECCGGGCCAPGKCTTVNGQTCCPRVVDNRPYCLRM